MVDGDGGVQDGLGSILRQRKRHRVIRPRTAVDGNVVIRLITGGIVIAGAGLLGCPLNTHLGGVICYGLANLLKRQCLEYAHTVSPLIDGYIANVIFFENHIADYKRIRCNALCYYTIRCDFQFRHIVPEKLERVVSQL